MENYNKWAKGCITKKAYDEESTAKYAVRRALKKYGKELDVYKCEFCLNYHLATKRKL